MKKTGRRRKIDLVQVERLRREGLSQAEIARRLNVSRSAICQSLQSVSGAIVRQAAMEAGHEILRLDLDTLREMSTANSRLNALLARLEGYLDKKDAAPMTEKAVAGLFLRGLAETRQQCRLMHDLMLAMSDFEQVAKFQEIVLNILTEEVNDEQKRRIINRFKDLRLIRAVTKFT